MTRNQYSIHHRMKRLEAHLLESFNEQQMIEGDDDLQTNDPENGLFQDWLSERNGLWWAGEVTLYLELRQTLQERGVQT